MRVQDLTIGDAFESGIPGKEGWATFIAKDWHPLYPGLMLVVWHLGWEESGDKQWSFDALSPLQELYASPQVPLTPEQRKANFKKVLESHQRGLQNG